MKPLTLREAAELLGVNPSTAWRLVQTGQLRALRIGRVYRIEAAELDSFKRRVEYRPAPVRFTRTPANLIDRLSH